MPFLESRAAPLRGAAGPVSAPGLCRWAARPAHAGPHPRARRSTRLTPDVATVP